MPDAGFRAEGIFISSNIKIIPTGCVSPPHKRDLGANIAQGRILAFLDDDAYPAPEWLSEAVGVFDEDGDFACVCGPAITPPEDSLRQIAGGLVYSSIFVTGSSVFRYVPGRRRPVVDFPSCNFLIKRDVFKAIGGFKEAYWPGEDTFLCLKLLKAGKPMIYDPKVLIFHHRRPLFKSHLCQIRNYALHRGYFVKKYPQTSLRFGYFIPSLFVAGLLFGGLVSLFSPFAGFIYSSVLAIYLIVIIINSSSLTFNKGNVFINSNNTAGAIRPNGWPEIFPVNSVIKPTQGIKSCVGEKGDNLLASQRSFSNWVNKIILFSFTISGIILTHLAYGVYFIKGLMSKKMPEQ